MEDKEKWVYGVFKNHLIYRKKIAEDVAFNEIKQLGYRLISKKKDHCNERQIVFTCYN